MSNIMVRSPIAVSGSVTASSKFSTISSGYVTELFIGYANGEPSGPYRNMVKASSLPLPTPSFTSSVPVMTLDAVESFVNSTMRSGFAVPSVSVYGLVRVLSNVAWVSSSPRFMAEVAGAPTTEMGSREKETSAALAGELRSRMYASKSSTTGEGWVECTAKLAGNGSAVGTTSDWRPTVPVSIPLPSLTVYVMLPIPGKVTPSRVVGTRSFRIVTLPSSAVTM